MDSEMNDSPFNLPPDKSQPAKSDGLGATVFLVLFATPFAGFGLLAAVQGIRKLIAGNTYDGSMLCLFGFIFSLVGFGLMFGAIWGRKKLKQTAGLRVRFADKLWMLRPDWAVGEIKSTGRGQAVLFWIMALAFCGFGIPILIFIIPQELHKGNRLALIALLFPLIGLAMMIAAVYQTLRQLKYGAVLFKLKSVPGIIGGVLMGTIRIPAHFQPQTGIALRLRCVRRLVTGSGKSRSVSEYVLWEDEKHLGGNLPRTGPMEYDVPVFFKIPADSRQCDDEKPDDRILWRLTANSKQAGIDFHADFEVPVFKVTDDIMGDIADPTAALQVPVAEVIRDEHSRIKVTDIGGAREFYFPPARNLMNLVGFTAAVLVWTTFTAAAFLLFHSLFFEIVFGLVNVLLVVGCCDMWLRSSRVTINATSVHATKHWLFLGPTRTFDADVITGFEIKEGMTSGQTVYYNLQLVTRAGRRCTVGNGVPNRLEADWLAKQMNRALGRGE
ncbi:MAG TPA: hypothetical protein VK815_09580 [Candidatus Acidoferrales bacterium]|jgi:hypothetical protein|nr:hypothetical protein [Candidatus Acidoferrales bacterium]